ncbi:MAG: hypothetical protein JOZ69_11550 [Myxococcales bacterium]|nr:hypothetical protein [Myxococcales bacterium]
MQNGLSSLVGAVCLALVCGAGCGNAPSTANLETKLRANIASDNHQNTAQAAPDVQLTASQVTAPSSTWSGVSTGEAGAQDAATTASPNAPAGPGGRALGWTPAVALNGVRVIPERDSVRLVLPAVGGAVDFRLFALDDSLGVTATSSGAEHLKTRTIACAGYRQRGIPTTTNELAAEIEFPGVTAATTFVLEAIDATCPYTGAYGPSHGQINAQNPEIASNLTGNYAIYTESEIDATYDALILNGQGPNPSHVGYPAPPVDPKVLRRTTFVAAPLGYSAAPPTSSFFDDFASEDPPKLYTTGADSTAWANGGQLNGIYVAQNSKWSFFAAASSLSTGDPGTSFEPVLFDRGRMHLIVSDGGQDDFSTFLAFPKRAAQMPSANATYLHMTYEVNNPVTDRRYWWLSLCGPDSASSPILDANGFPLNVLTPDSSMQSGGAKNFGSLGWNCLTVVPRNATCLNGCAQLGPDNTTPETDIGIFVHPSGKGSTSVNVNPTQYGSQASWFDGRWYRQMDANGNLVGPMLDDVNLAGQTVRFDVYVRKDRVVLYVNGQQRVCNDFPSKALTMKSAAVGFGQVLYHTADEHLNIGPDGQYCAPIANTPSMRHIYYNEPYLDSRDWDNVGFDENVSLPGGMPSFDSSLCYVSP